MFLLEKFLFLFPLEVGAYIIAGMTMLLNCLVVMAKMQIVGLTSANSGNFIFHIFGIVTAILLLRGSYKVGSELFLN